MENLTTLHHYLFTEVADARVKSWPLMSDPTPGLFILATYFVGLKPAKKFMENKPAFELRRFMFFYNTFQICANAWVASGTINSSSWLTNLHYFWSCHAVDYSNNLEAMRTLKLAYFFSLLKFLELVETYVFILRKKNSQVTYLHLYHHVITVCMGWCAVKYVGGGMVIFQGMLNSTIHVIMYSYYFLTALGPSWRKACQKWKVKITAMQMVQFCFLIAHASLALRKDCPVPSLFFYMYAPNVLVIFFLFGNFFRQTYVKKKNETDILKKA